MHSQMRCESFGEAWVLREKKHPFAVVFVHGWDGDYRKTWTSSSGHIVNLLQNEGLPCDYYFFSHSAGSFSLATTSTIALSLKTFLTNYTAKKFLILVAHSLGGLICRKAILNSITDESNLKDRFVGLIMYGTPNDGTEMARAGAITFSATAKEMKPYNEFISELNRGWLDSVVNGGNPETEVEKRFAHLHCTSVLGEEDLIVPAASAAALSHLCDIEVINKGHIELPKAASESDPTYVLLVGFIRKCHSDLPRRDLANCAAELQDRIRKSLRDADEWSKEERDTIELIEEKPLAESVKNKIYTCNQVSLRKGVMPKETILIGVRAKDYEYVGVKVDFDFIIGPGLMSKKSFKDIAEKLKSTSSPEDLNGLIRVTSIETFKRDTDKRIPYAFSGFDYGPGYVVEMFSRGELPGEVDRSYSLEFKIQTKVQLGQGWHTVRANRPITDSWSTNLIAPFDTIATPYYDSKYVKASGCTDYGHSQTSNRVTIEGPIPRGTIIRWVFVPDDSVTDNVGK